MRFLPAEGAEGAEEGAEALAALASLSASPGENAHVTDRRSL